MNKTIQKKTDFLEERISLENEILGYRIVSVDAPSGPGWCPVQSFKIYNQEALKDRLREIVNNHLIRKGIDVLKHLRKKYPFVKPEIRIPVGGLTTKYFNRPDPTYLEFYADKTLDHIHIKYVGGDNRSFDYCILDLSIEKIKSTSEI